MRKDAEKIQDLIISEKYEGKLPDSDIIRKYQNKVIELDDPELALFFSESVDGYDKEAISQIVINSLEPDIDRESLDDEEEVDMRMLISGYSDLSEAGKLEVINYYESLELEEKEKLNSEILENGDDEEISKYIGMLHDIEFYNDVKKRYDKTNKLTIK